MPESQTNVSQLLQALNEEFQQTISGGNTDISVDGLFQGSNSNPATTQQVPFQGKRSSGGYVPT